MAAGGGGPTLKQFLLRGHVLKLYRDCLRTARAAPSKQQRAEIEDWVKADFRANQKVPLDEEERIKALVYNGEKMLRELRQSMDLATA